MRSEKIIFEMQDCPNDPDGKRGFRRWWYTIRLRKMELWGRLHGINNGAGNLRTDWLAAMTYMSKRIELMTTLTLVCIHKNIRGFPETQCHFGGGTWTDIQEMDGGEVGVADLREVSGPAR